MLIRSRAPLRLGLAGGGTDVSPYSDIYGGAILNATISSYAYTSIEPSNDNIIEIISIDQKKSIQYKAETSLEIDGNFDLVKGVYNRIIKEFVKKPLSFTIYTYADAPAGSGLGTSSTMVVSIIGAFTEWLQLPLGEYDIAQLAFEIERLELKQAGGKQDQYSATFGGFNYMEFYSNKTIVNPLRIKKEIIDELQYNLILYYTGTSRLSSKIIESQIQSVEEGKSQSIEAMHNLKEQSVLMKEAILTGNLDKVGEILNYGWQNKKKMANNISNPIIDEIYEYALKAGSTGGKISGAGGGGFMMFYCPKNTKYKVIEALNKFGGEVWNYHFAKYGLKAWKI